MTESLSVTSQPKKFPGGKDCTLTLHLLSAQPEKYNIVSLITFTPVTTKPFLAHPQHLIKLQSLALALPHQFLSVTPPYVESYRSLIISCNTDVLATGDILDVCNRFMDRVVEGTDVELVRPLWERERTELIEEIFKLEFEVLISCVNLEKVEEEVARKLVGNILTRDLYENVILKQDVDGCGEMGEYHSMVLNAPLFKKRIVIKKGKQTISEDGKFLFFEIQECEAVDKIVGVDV
ncbi:20883_t:CDS:2 [Dentiscutata erythropus]|uniref:Diphthine--ammonia ligase n=1 Tax=Dentiscutata erythropus TaxID=1348616 RepID=A0A9N9IYJ8_9GLOM|nr:20883_t:CDS:2 [Dentiscutata erythropus]